MYPSVQPWHIKNAPTSLQLHVNEAQRARQVKSFRAHENNSISENFEQRVKNHTAAFALTAMLHEPEIVNSLRNRFTLYVMHTVVPAV